MLQSVEDANKDQDNFSAKQLNVIILPCFSMPIIFDISMLR